MSYLIILFLHLLGVITFVGNLLIGLYWKSIAEKKVTRQSIEYTLEGIMRTDKIFTMPGLIVLILFGIGGAAHVGFNLLTTGWIFWSIIMIIISGAAYMGGVLPAQKKILALTKDEDKYTMEQYKVHAKQWNLWGTIALVAPIIAIILMTLKIPD